MADMTLVEDLTIDNSNEALSIDEAVPHLEKELQSSLGSDGFLSDVVTTSVAELESYVHLVARGRPQKNPRLRGTA